MKIKKIFIGVFTFTFLIGCLFFAFYISSETKKNEVSQTELPEINETEVDAAVKKADEASSQEENHAETDYADEDFSDYSIEMLQTGEFHEDEVEAKSGEKWLGLFIEKDKSYLAWTKLKVTNVRDEIVDGDKGRMTGKKVSVENRLDPVFLLKNAANLKAGKTATLFDSRRISDDEIYEKTDLKNGFKKDFYMNEKKFTLKVVNESSTDENISAGSKLILVSGESEQIVHPRKGERVGESWTLLWAGDLDNDGKLDFFADISDHYNASMPTLFLSSEAEPGKLVKEVAGVRTLGC